MLIESPKNSRVKELIKLRDSRTRRKLNRFILEGDREVLRAIRSGIEITQLFVCAEYLREEGQEAIKESGIDPFFISPLVFEKLALRSMSGGLVATAIPRYYELSHLDETPNPFILVVETVEKPGNLGAILRTADGSGADMVVVLDQTTDIYNPNCIRASLGGLFSVPVAKLNTDQFVDYCQREAVQVLAASPDGKAPYYESDLRGPTALIFGSEALGLSPLWSEIATLISIPMHGICDSLNVSVSAAIISYELRRQRILSP